MVIRKRALQKRALQNDGGAPQVRGSAVTGSGMAGVHVKWGGTCLLETSSIANGRQAGVLVEGAASRIQMAACSVRGVHARPRLAPRARKPYRLVAAVRVLLCS
jgi:hypothetical protein